MKKSLLIITTFLAIQIFAQDSQIQIDSIGKAVNESGKTRMLAMRIAAMYGAQTSDKVPGKIKRETEKKQIQAQTNLNEIYNALTGFDPVLNNMEALQAVTNAKEIWGKMRRSLSKEASPIILIDILNYSEKLLAANEEMTKAISVLSTHANADIVNISGRQRMYAMRLTRDYIAASIGVDKENRIDLMLETATNFESAMLVLETADVNSSEVVGMVNSIAKMEWRHVYKSITECIESNGTRFNEMTMLKFADTLLEKTNKLTDLYAGLF